MELCREEVAARGGVIKVRSDPGFRSGQIEQGCDDV